MECLQQHNSHTNFVKIDQLVQRWKWDKQTHTHTHTHTHKQQQQQQQQQQTRDTVVSRDYFFSVIGRERRLKTLSFAAEVFNMNMEKLLAQVQSPS